MARTEKNSDLNNKLAYLSIGLTIVLCCAVAIGLVCLDMNRKQQLQQMTAEIDNLKQAVSNLRQQLKHQENLLNNTATTVKQIKSEDNTRKQEEEDGEYDYDYDEENYYDEDDGNDAGEEEEDTAPPPLLVITDENATDSVREKRHAIPVVEESYLTSSHKSPFTKNFTGSSRLLLYGTLLQKGDKYVGTHSTYTPNRMATNSYTPQRQWTTRQPLYVIQRVSRVMRTPDTSSTSRPSSTVNPHEMPADSSRPAGRLSTINPHVSHYTQYEEQRQPEETIVRPHSRRRSKQRSRHHDVEVFSGETETTGNTNSVVAAHFGGDTTKYRTGHHRHYDGNDRMYHPDGRFKDWVPSNWVTSTGMASYFPLQDGKIRVTRAGLYLVYAQIYYADHHDINGFRVYHNDNIVAQCTTMTYSLADSQRVMKRNTCFTSALIYVQASDTISLREVEGERYTIFEPTKSFVGLVRLHSGT